MKAVAVLAGKQVAFKKARKNLCQGLAVHVVFAIGKAYAPNARRIDDIAASREIEQA